MLPKRFSIKTDSDSAMLTQQCWQKCSLISLAGSEVWKGEEVVPKSLVQFDKYGKDWFGNDTFWHGSDLNCIQNIQSPVQHSNCLRSQNVCLARCYEQSRKLFFCGQWNTWCWRLVTPCDWASPFMAMVAGPWDRDSNGPLNRSRKCYGNVWFIGHKSDHSLVAQCRVQFCKYGNVSMLMALCSQSIYANVFVFFDFEAFVSCGCHHIQFVFRKCNWRISLSGLSSDVRDILSIFIILLRARDSTTGVWQCMRIIESSHIPRSGCLLLWATGARLQATPLSQPRKISNNKLNSASVSQYK